MHTIQLKDNYDCGTSNTEWKIKRKKNQKHYKIDDNNRRDLQFKLIVLCYKLELIYIDTPFGLQNIQFDCYCINVGQYKCDEHGIP